MKRRLPPGTWPALIALACILVLVGCNDQPVEQELVVEQSAAPTIPVMVSAAVDRSTATTGDRVNYTIVVNAEDDYRVEAPEVGEEIADLKVLEKQNDAQPARPSASGAVRTETAYRFLLRADLVGSYILPAVELAVVDPAGSTTSVVTEEIYLDVESVLPEGEELADILDVKPLFRFPEAGRLWLWLLMLGLLFLAVWWIWRARQRAAARVLAALTPHEWAFGELDRLRKTDFTDLNSVRRYYFSISQVIREYVERRYQLNATDLTTPEILGRLGSLEDLRPAAAEKLSSFLEATDQVKFAKHSPETAEIELAYENALTFVEGTARAPETPVQEPLVGASS